MSMSTRNALFDYTSSGKVTIPRDERVMWTRQQKQSTQGDIARALDALDLQGLQQRISTVANTDSKSRLEVVVHDWQTIARRFQYQPWETLNSTARFPIGLPACQELDSTLRTANSEFDRIASLNLTPSEFAKPRRWTEQQEKTNKILCFRPVKRGDLPVTMFHPAFGRYLARVRSKAPLPHDDSDARGAAISAFCLQGKMGNAFTYPGDRGQTFEQCLAEPPFGQNNWEFESRMYGQLLHQTVQVTLDNACFGVGPGIYRLDKRDYPVLLRVDKDEPGDADDPYMHVVRAYQQMVPVIQDLVESGAYGDEPAWLLENGVPVLCLCLDGPNLQVLGAFFDGENHIVEPLGPTVSMLADGIGASRRRSLLARVLYELCQAIREIANAQLERMNPSITFEPGVPRIYDSCRALDSNEICQLTLVSRVEISNDSHPFCKATWIPPGSDKTEPVLVKATDGPYGIDVQRALAAKGYAPRLHAISEREGAPTAYVMDELGEEEWIQLDDLRYDHTEAYYDAKPAIRQALDRIIDFLEQEGLVHGDLRAGHIMVKFDGEQKTPCISGDGFATLKLVNFDWAGRGDQVFYPYERDAISEGVKWPGVSGGPIEVGHDRQLVGSWFDSFWAIGWHTAASDLL